MRRDILHVAANALIGALSLMPASAVEIQPGLWEIKTVVDHNGAVSTRPPRLRCVSAESASAAGNHTLFGVGPDAKAVLDARFGKDACKLADTKNAKDLVSWRLRCAGKMLVDQEGSARFETPQHYTATIRSRITDDGKTMTSVVTSEARRTGDCPR